MKRSAVLLTLLLHACAAMQVSKLNDKDFLAALTNGLPTSNGEQKRKCDTSDDLSSLGEEQFLALLAGDCDNSTDEAEPVQTCERGEFLCTPYHRCNQEDIYSDGQGAFSVRIGLAQFEQERNLVSHSECTLFNDVCCSDPQPRSVEPQVPEAPYVPRCGRRNQDGLGSRILGFADSESQFGEFPWMTAVLQQEEIDGQQRLGFVGGGSLIHPQVVLTSAHQVAGLSPNIRMMVRLGEWDTQHESELHRHEDFAVIDVKVHPDFNPRTLRDDVALLVLERPAQLQSHIDTLCLPSPGVNYDYAGCVTTGWGKDAMEDGLYQTVLKQVELPHVPRAECQALLRKTSKLGRYFRLDRSFTCAGGSAGQDACKGDGGAPLACRDPQQPDRFVQLGVVAWGIGCGMEGVPGVYADVRPQLSWINGLISEVEQAGSVDLSLFERNRTPLV